MQQAGDQQPQDSAVRNIRQTDHDVGSKIDAAILSDKDPRHVQALYDRWAATYEEDLTRVDGGYSNPQLIVNCFCRFVSDPNVRILDVACGTGLVAKELRARGFLRIDGLDGSQQMLAIAEQRGLYDNCFHELVGEEQLRHVADASYDQLITTGSFLPGHMTAKCLRTLGRAVRRGGAVFICLREAALQDPELQDLEPRMAELEKDGFWIRKHRAVVQNYYNHFPGVEYVFEKL